MTDPVRMIVGSAHPVWLRGFVQLLECFPGIHLVGFAESARPLADLIVREPTDMLVIEASLVVSVRKLLPATQSVPRILVVGTGTHAGTRPPFGPYCSCGYFGERDSAAKIFDLVGEVARCKVPRAGRPECSGCRVPTSFQPPPLPLTGRENEVFVHIGWGLRPSEIASELGVNVKTVETHRESIKRKLGLRSATELVELAIGWREGALVTPRRPRSARPSPGAGRIG